MERSICLEAGNAVRRLMNTIQGPTMDGSGFAQSNFLFEGVFLIVNFLSHAPA